jgi:ankyrin repeat protein
VQLPLIDLLCDHGADPSSAVRAALSNGEFEAVNALIQLGVRIDLPVAAALGRTKDVLRLLPAADNDDRHRALALASRFGHLESVRALLDAGEDPDRYNPVGFHSHSTPIHQAALAGHDQLVRLLVERGARVDLKDILWHGTPADWAEHAGNTELKAYLRAQQNAKARA